MNLTDILGLLAPALIISSFMLKDLRKLRWVNTVGCALFVAYGVLLDMNLPIIITNAFIIGINMWQLFFVKE